MEKIYKLRIFYCPRAFVFARFKFHRSPSSAATVSCSIYEIMVVYSPEDSQYGIEQHIVRIST